MVFRERILLGPGPSNISPGVAQSFLNPLVGHLDPLFLESLDELNTKLKNLFQTKSSFTTAISATGSGGMEAIVANFIDEDTKATVAINGAFGERVADMIKRFGGNLNVANFDWGTPFDPEKVAKSAKEHGSKIIFCVHAETSTGVKSDVRALAELKGEALLAVDCVTSLGGIEFYMDKWGIDIAYSATQKCLSAPPGLAPIALNERALGEMLKRPRSWYFDLNQIAKYVLPNSERKYHHTAPILMLNSLNCALTELLNEGLESAWERHSKLGQLLWENLESLGFELVVEKDFRLPQLTLVKPPENEASQLSEAEIRKRLLDDYSIEIGGGLGPFSGKYMRVGLMGYSASLKNITLLSGALKEIISK